jgi:hypothetical protein
MILGAAQIEITPRLGGELSGFAARVQPSLGVLDPLFAKAVYLMEGDQQLLWVHCDLIGFDLEIVNVFRSWANKRFGLSSGAVMLSATHTHSGPCTIRLQEAGNYDAAYVQFLQTRLRVVAEQAFARTENCEPVNIEGQIDLAVDRRQTASPHTDSCVGAIGFKRGDGSFNSVIVNYAMHPVALGAGNRHISADVPGQTALALAAQLPGNPIVLVTNGACANLNPPAENVSPHQIADWGKQIADSIAGRLQRTVLPAKFSLHVFSHTVPLPLDTLDVDGINAFAEKALQDRKSLAEWSDKYCRVVEHWRDSLIADAQTGRRVSHRDGELFGVCLGDLLFLGVNAEVFSEFTAWLRKRIDKRIYLVGYANGDVGYLSSRSAYAEGGYEVDTAHLFYGGFRFKPGSLEVLLEGAQSIIQAQVPFAAPLPL